MRIERIVTKQGHPVPETAHQPKGPFPPELFETAPVVTDYLPQPDRGVDVPIGGTAQNNFSAMRWFRCRVCETVLREPEVNDHNCED
jgi:hypothetical protein